ncbi:MAG: outer membrane lipoprotein carrier protein LolA [Acidobacteria bacterium]|nr:outer membrane lipoprotein carrier protein LolA [Acidobacteriota bacterium]
MKPFGGGVTRHMTGWKVFSVVAFAAGAAASLIAAPQRGTLLDEVLAKVDAKQKNVRAIEADFVQTKELDLLAEAGVSRGRFAYQEPNRVVWEYESPARVTMVIADGKMTTYYPDLGRAERMEIKRFEQQIFRYMAAGTGALDELKEYFNLRFVDDAAKGSYLLELSPKTKLIARRVQGIRIWIDKESYFTTAFEWTEGDGDTTRMEFSDVKINPRFDSDRFELDIPGNVKIEEVSFDR